MIRKQSEEGDQENSQQINLSEYLDSAYNKFNTDYKIKYQEEDDADEDYMKFQQ